MKSLFPLKEISLRALIYKIHKSEVLVGGRVCVGGEVWGGRPSLGITSVAPDPLQNTA